jgi:hypothetical protein
MMDSTANLARDHLLVQPSIAASVVAAGTDRSSATQILATWARVVSVPAGSGVRLPPAVVGLEVVVVRADPSSRTELAVYANGSDAISTGSLITLDGAQESAAVFACFVTGRWEISSCNGALYWPALLQGAGAIAGSAILIARTSPRLAGAGTISGKAVAWGIVWSDLKAAGAISATASVSPA